jgi:mono/diheme cytochrome c family protein
MKKIPLILLATAPALLLLSLAARSATYSAVLSNDDSAVREKGKQIFTAKCGQCHDADAAKRLPDGSTLLARLAASKNPEARLATRLNKMSEEDHHAVVVYMTDLITQYAASKKSPNN